MDPINMEYWMTNLPPQLRQMPLIHLAIPGSHDSMTAAITKSSKLSPDAETILKRLHWLGPILRTFVYRWCRTQILNTIEQLKQGIRYFDLRVATKTGTVNPYFVHGLYGDQVSAALLDIRNFVDTHSDEVIILDFQHFYQFTNVDHQRLITLITTTFRYKLVPRTGDMKSLNLDNMTRSNKYQVIVVYRSRSHGDPFLWPSESFPTPWPNTTSPTELIAQLDIGVAQRQHNIAFISQCLLTPTNYFVFRHIFSTLQAQCVIPLQPLKCEWINRQKIGENGVNIIIGDFVNLNSGEFALEVVRLNLKSNSSYHASTLTPVD